MDVHRVVLIRRAKMQGAAWVSNDPMQAFLYKSAVAGQTVNLLATDCAQVDFDLCYMHQLASGYGQKQPT